MVTLQRGVPRHVKEKDLRRSRPFSASDAEWERYARAAQERDMSLSAYLRMLAERDINQVDGAFGVTKQEHKDKVSP